MAGRILFSTADSFRIFKNTHYSYSRNLVILPRQFSQLKGLVLGVYTDSSNEYNEISSYTEAFEDIDKRSKGKLLTHIKATGPFCKFAKHKILWAPSVDDAKENSGYNCIAVVDLGSKDPKVNLLEDRDEKNENIRCSIADGISALKRSANFDEIHLDLCDNPKSVGEAASLTIFSYDELKTKSSGKPKCAINLYAYENISKDVISEYKKGVICGESQNFARQLMEAPANLMTPSLFSSTVKAKLDSNVQVFIRDKAWMESMKMHSFLSVTRGSIEEPKFLELHYSGAGKDKKCIALVGKGVTFDSGGISLKPASRMDLMRADMGGAACVVSTVLAASLLNLKVNIKAFMPLTENMPGGKATKPGDVVTAMNGKTIQIDDTDAEGRLILCDALTYAQQFKPAAVLDFATLTGAVKVALGSACSGVFCNDEKLWNLFHEAGRSSGDRVWRLPLFKHYTKAMTKCQLADLNNVASGKGGGACTAAAFLQEFIEPETKWLHADIAGVMTKDSYDVSYLCKEMTGRPTRTIIEFFEALSKDLSALE